MDNKEIIAERTPLKPHEWVNAHADYLYAYTITRVNNEEQARDLVQETFLAALEGMHKFEGKARSVPGLPRYCGIRSLIPIVKKRRG
jgi:DNA-directed RNA polymerase specialized sigma24 family protein